MKLPSLIIVLFFLHAVVSAQSKNVIAAHDLAKRIVPSFAGRIVFKEIKSINERDVFELESKHDTLFIGGNSSNSMAVGLNFYLKNFCNTSVSWHPKDKIFLPVKMPQVKEFIHQEALTQNRFFLNYCTFGYTMPWWNWHDWERFIDWMALNGINLPLAITGEEYIWYKVWKKFGLNDEQIRSYFTGPAYLPWHRMANIDYWEGPLPHSWLNNQLELQKKIVERERILAMKPVLPAFAGHVPEAIKTKFPKAKITSLGNWGDFDKKYLCYFLDPFDSLFYPIQKEFLTEQTKLFGTDHIYGTDPFNEVKPPSWEPDYLASASKVIYNSMASVDADAQWLQMGWIFFNAQREWTSERIKAYLRAVPQDKMILLDYFCDNTEIWKRTESFFGQPYIWCYLGNFGGNTMLSGYMKEVEQRLENTFKNGGQNLWGLGSTLEGFGINPIIYEYVLDKAWSSGPVDVDAWVKSWAKRRYGSANENVIKAWDILLNTTYAEQAGIGRGTLTNTRPVLQKFQSWTTNPEYHYDNKNLVQAWGLLNSVTGNLTDVYQYDVVTVGNQAMGNYFTNVRDEFTKAYTAKDLKQLTFLGNKMLGIINDMDELLATNKNLLVGDWIETAKTFAASEQEKKYYEQDARKIITVWGQKGRDLTDYANRSIAGLMKDYYGGRWKMFIDEIINCVKTHKQYDEKQFSKKVADFEEHWAEGHNAYLSVAKGNSLEISKKLYAKYSAEIQAVK